MDDGPAGVASTLTEAHAVPGSDKPAWRPVSYISRAKTVAELNYGKVYGESLGVLSRIKEHRMYLYSTRFTCVVYHEHLIPMYNSHSRELPARVARHKLKLTGFDFEVIYEPDTTTPSDQETRERRGSTLPQRDSE